MLSIYNFLKVKLCYRTYWKQWLLFLIITLLFSFNSFGQTEEKITYYESGAVYSKTNYLDGLRQGEKIMYYESGAVEYKGNFVDDLVQGEVIYYNKKGEIKEIMNYKDGVLIKE